MKEIKRKNPEGRKLFDGKDYDIVVQKLETVWALGGSDAEASYFAEISKAALSDFLKKNPLISERKEALKEKPILLSRQILLQGIKGDAEKGILPNPELAFKYLERKCKSEFAPHSSNELLGKDGNDFVLNIRRVLSDEEKRLIGDKSKQLKEKV